jgi:hypothetical protein
MSARRRTVLVVTNVFDVHADSVIVEPRRRDVPVFRLHTESFPRETRLALSLADGTVAGRLANPWHTLRLEDVGSVWYRRPDPPGFDERLHEDASTYAERQAKDALTSLYSVTEALWVNDPFSLRRAEAKALQLREAPDLILTPDGEVVFLELNPNGQWLWLELELGLPLTEAFADVLAA